jgi:hypothetical protein
LVSRLSTMCANATKGLSVLIVFGCLVVNE